MTSNHKPYSSDRINAGPNAIQFSGVRAPSIRVNIPAACAFALFFSLMSASCFGQRIVDTSPKFAPNTAAATRAMTSGGVARMGNWSSGNWGAGAGHFHNGWVPGHVGFGPVGFGPVGFGPYRVQRIGHDPNYLFSAYSNPRQYGAHDHGFRHQRDPRQAHFNQFGRNHWLITPTYGWGCGPWATGCGPWGNPCLLPSYFPVFPAYCGPISGGWPLYGPAFGGWPLHWQNPGCFGTVVTQRYVFGVQLSVGQYSGLTDLAPSRSEWGPGGYAGSGGVFQTSGPSPSPGETASSLLERNAATVLAQHRAIAELEQQAAAARRSTSGVTTATSLDSGTDPLGNPKAASNPRPSNPRPSGATSDGPGVNRPAVPSRKKPGLSESDRERLLKTLRGG